MMVSLAWTDERRLLAKRYWLEGESAAQVAKRLGVTRAAVIGQIYRMGLTRKGAVVRQEPRNPNLGAARPRHERPAPPPRRSPAALATVPSESPADTPSVPIEAFDRRPIERLDGKLCAWPVGDTRSPDFRFCDANPVLGRPYCAEHCRRAGISSNPKGLVVMGRVAKPYRIGRGDL